MTTPLVAAIGRGVPHRRQVADADRWKMVSYRIFVHMTATFRCLSLSLRYRGHAAVVMRAGRGALPPGNLEH
jgi:hypothetical protein